MHCQRTRWLRCRSGVDDELDGGVTARCVRDGHRVHARAKSRHAGCAIAIDRIRSPVIGCKAGCHRRGTVTDAAATGQRGAQLRIDRWRVVDHERDRRITPRGIGDGHAPVARTEAGDVLGTLSAAGSRRPYITIAGGSAGDRGDVRRAIAITVAGRIAGKRTSHRRATGHRA
jgi:hypothetical protein